MAIAWRCTVYFGSLLYWCVGEYCGRRVRASRSLAGHGAYAQIGLEEERRRVRVVGPVLDRPPTRIVLSVDPGHAGLVRVGADDDCGALVEAIVADHAPSRGGRERAP